MGDPTTTAEYAASGFPRVRLVGERRPWRGVQGDFDYAPLECGHPICIPSDYVDDGTVPCGECAHEQREAA